MHQWPLTIRIFRKPRFFPLRFRFIFLSSCLLILLLGGLALLLNKQQNESIRSQVRQRALAIAQSLAATSKAHFATYNYIALEQTANQAAQDPDMVYVIIHDKEGRVAGYSERPDLQGKFLDDELTSKALATKQSLVQSEHRGPGDTPVLEAACPVFLPGSEYRWGTVRVALSLQPMYEQIRQTQLTIGGVGIVAVLFGIAVSIRSAHSITRPLGKLVQATIEAARGNLPEDIEVESRDEVGVLAYNFSIMVREILTQREQLEVQLLEIKRLQRHTEQLLNTMSDGLVSVDTVGRVTTINPAASHMLGTRSENLLGASLSSILPENHPLIDFIQRSLRDSDATFQDEINVEVNGEREVMLVGSSILTDVNGSPTEVIMSLHNITKLKELEARVRQSERLAALGTLAAGMAHEIRNPLSAIKTFVQLLPRKVEKPGFLDKFQRTVPRELERINGLIEDLLELAREPKYHFDFLSIEVLLHHCFELFESELATHRIDCRMELAEGLPQVRADADQLAKAFQNLFKNSIQAMPDGGRLTVEATWQKPSAGQSSEAASQDGWIVLIFRDNGVGISSDDLKSIFNPFFTTKDSGTGLGLAITHKVVTEHGGHIDVASHWGKGTGFTIHLPVVKKYTEIAP